MSFLIRFFSGILLCPIASAQINASFFPFKDIYLVRGTLTDVAVLNLTKDTLQDVIVTDYANDNITLFENAGGCPNSLSLKNYIPAGDGPVALQTGDFNQDGRQEFVVLNALSHTVTVYKNHIRPDGVVSILPAGTYSLRNSCNAILANDIDGDGKSDLLITQAAVWSMF